MSSEYEKSKQENIRKNRELLMQLGLDKPLHEPVEKVIKKAAPSKKRKLPEAQLVEGDAVEDTKAKVQRVDESDSPSSTLRRSSRNVGNVVDYRKEIIRGSPLPVAYSSGVKALENEGPMGREDGPRKYDPKTYGAIPGIAVGTWWQTRQGCSADSIHAPWVAGISGGKQGAHSVALSGGYDDDVDLGYAFTYTGSGGRDLKGTKMAPKNLRTAPQSSDQSFDNPFNQMLKRSCETKKPVRVIRGFKLKSPYAPSEGYRYDGLYQVEKAWLERGLNKKGYLVCKYAFKRLPNQPALPVRNTKPTTEGESESDNNNEDDGKTGDVDEVEESDEEKEGADANGEATNEEGVACKEDANVEKDGVVEKDIDHVTKME